MSGVFAQQQLWTGASSRCIQNVGRRLLRFRTRIRSAQTRKAVERLLAKQVCYLRPLVNNSSECCLRAGPDRLTEARLVAVSGRSLFQEKARDDFRLKGWLGGTETTFGREWDKGHFVAHSIGGAVDRVEVIVFVQLRAESGMVGGRKALSGDGSLLRDKSGNVLLQPLDLRRSNGAPGVLRICF